MAHWGAEELRTLFRRDEVTGSGMDMVRHGIDLPSYEMSHDAMNHTIDMINRLPLSEVFTLRYIHIGFGCWSCALAIMVIVRVWYDSWRSHQLSASGPRRLVETKQDWRIC